MSDQKYDMIHTCQRCGAALEGMTCPNCEGSGRDFDGTVCCAAWALEKNGRVQSVAEMMRKRRGKVVSRLEWIESQVYKEMRQSFEDATHFNEALKLLAEKHNLHVAMTQEGWKVGSTDGVVLEKFTTFSQAFSFALGLLEVKA